jgi:hypothetical protein
MTSHRLCNGVRRRDFLQAGALGVAGLSLADLLRAESMTAGDKQQARSAIILFLEGGPSHLDTFDPKPEAASEVRGEFKSISTKVPGLHLSEHLPKIAGCADQFALLRGVTHTLGDHGLGKKYLACGTRPIASIEYPEYGAVLSERLPSDPDIPAHVAIPRAVHGSGYLGMEYASFDTGAFAQAGRPMNASDLSLLPKTSPEALESRRDLTLQLDKRFRSVESSERLLLGMDRFSQQAYDMLRSPRTRNAFDLSKEAPTFSRLFGADPISQSCLAAIRLVEAGVRCVTVNFGGWDTHTSNFASLRQQLLPQLDSALSGLLAGLGQRGLLKSTSVLVTGEFGRSPIINDRQPSVGREHHARCMFMLMAGGDVVPGQVLGESDSIGDEPKHTGISPDDVAATFYANLGVDHTHVYDTSAGRPMTLVRDGSVIRDLLAS